MPVRLFMTELTVPHDRLGAVMGWYTHVLGLTVVLHDPEGGFALLGEGPGHLALHASQTPVPAWDACRLVFRVDDVDAEAERLRGVLVEVGPVQENEKENYREVRLTDPLGTPITLFAWTRPR